MKKFAIMFGSGIGDVQKRAVEELGKTLRDYTLEYPVCREVGQDAELSDHIKIYIGTKQSNP